MPDFDYALVGGGLQSGLLVQALRARQPDARIILIERAEMLGGNHTWCFHQADVDPVSRAWLEPLVRHRWTGYDVLFLEARRTVEEPYSCVTSERLHEVVAAAFDEPRGSRLLLGTEATALGPTSVTLGSGERISATTVIDARGPERPGQAPPAGFQKFVGLEVELNDPHRLERPVLMDATVDQSDGYRFFYLLPMSERRVLVEDTYFHESPTLDRNLIRREVEAYIDRRGWRVASVEREEHGVLPMPWANSFEPQESGPLRAGYRGGWFHPGTGYSFPVAARLAEFVAQRPAGALFGRELARFSSAHARQVRFAQFLNRLLFRWYPAPRRRAIFERFYRLPRRTIRNFYALQLRRTDLARLLGGRPPPGLSVRHRWGPGSPAGGA